MHVFIHKSHLFLRQGKVLRASDGRRVTGVPGVVADDNVVAPAATTDDVMVVWVGLKMIEI